MTSKEFYKQLESYSIIKGIDVELVFSAFEKGLINAYKKENGNAFARVEFKKEKNEIRMFARYKVVSETNKMEEVVDAKPVSLIEAKKIKSYAKVGDVIESEITIKDFRRLAISQAKQVFTQNIKNIEREDTLEKFKTYEHEILSLQVLDVKNPGFLRLRLDEDSTTIIKISELIPNETIKRGDNLTVYVRKIENTKKGVFLDTTRLSPKLIVRLLEKNIPEVAEGVIEIKGISRDPGRLTKICVQSNNPNVDAVGSIIGERGGRINEILKHIANERIELFEFNEDAKVLITNSLSPVNVSGIAHLDEVTKECIVVVPDEEVSLAIGKKGSNIRLLLEISGYNNIEIKSETQATEENLTW